MNPTSPTVTMVGVDMSPAAVVTQPVSTRRRSDDGRTPTFVFPTASTRIGPSGSGSSGSRARSITNRARLPNPPDPEMRVSRFWELRRLRCIVPHTASVLRSAIRANGRRTARTCFSL